MKIFVLAKIIILTMDKLNNSFSTSKNISEIYHYLKTISQKNDKRSIVNINAR